MQPTSWQHGWLAAPAPGSTSQHELLFGLVCTKFCIPARAYSVWEETRHVDGELSSHCWFPCLCSLCPLAGPWVPVRRAFQRLHSFPWEAAGFDGGALAVVLPFIPLCSASPAKSLCTFVPLPLQSSLAPHTNAQRSVFSNLKLSNFYL